jgi:hypothetical protein
MSGNQNSPVKNIKYVHINPGLQGIHIMRLKTGLKSTCYAYKMIKYHNIPHRSPKSGKKKKKDTISTNSMFIEEYGSSKKYQIGD